MDSCSDDLNKIEDILNKFKKKLTKIEKMLILIQERELFFNTNDKKKRITKKEKEEIAKLKIDLFKKLNQLNLSIETLESNPKIDSYFKALESYDELRRICKDLFNVMFAFLFEDLIKSLIKALSYKIDDSDPLEDSKMSTKSIPVPDDIFDKSFYLLSF